MTIATQATLAALLAKTLTAPATEAKQDTGNTSLATIVTNTASLATAAGQTSTGTKLDTLHSDLTGTLGTKISSTTVTGTITALNGAVDGTTDLSAYSSVSVQVSGTFTGSMTFQVSNDGSNWQTKALIGSSTSVNSTAGSALIASGDLGARYFRAFGNAWASGTMNVTIHYKSAPATTTANTSLGASTSVIGAVTVGSATPSKLTATSAASTNTTSTKTSAGTLYEITVANPSAATVYLKLYNKASAPTVGTDVPVFTIPVAATSYVSQPFGVTGKRFTTGIAWALTGAFAATDTTATAAGVQIDGTYV